MRIDRHAKGGSDLSDIGQTICGWFYFLSHQVPHYHYHHCELPIHSHHTRTDAGIQWLTLQLCVCVCLLVQPNV